MQAIRKPLVYLLFVLEGLPLLIYPFVLLANLMSLAGHRTGNESVFLITVVLLFIIMSSAYPLSYLYAINHYRIRRNVHVNKWILFLPVLHIIIVVLLGYLWGLFSISGRH